jgi:hypothetical protein
MNEKQFNDFIEVLKSINDNLDFIGEGIDLIKLKLESKCGTDLGESLADLSDAVTSVVSRSWDDCNYVVNTR